MFRFDRYTVQFVGYDRWQGSTLLSYPNKALSIHGQLHGLSAFKQGYAVAMMFIKQRALVAGLHTVAPDAVQ